MRGSRVAITTLEPDIIIDLDVSPVGKMNSLEMGAGVGIKYLIPLQSQIGIWLNNAKNLPEKMMWSIREKSVIVEPQN